MNKQTRKAILKLSKKRGKLEREWDKLVKFNPNCVDCGVNTHHINESYMVHNRIWKKAGMKPNGGRLCVGCIEKRLGRKLTCRDFFICGLNIDAYIYPYKGSKRLRKRLHPNGW